VSPACPTRYEDALRGHATVAGVAGLPDPVLGQRVGALLVLTDDAARHSVRNIVGWLGERVAAYKFPEVIAVADMVPPNP
jgi:acyl-CoA synthetase (AMP-forming)/AMP-acid ligase II